MSKRLVGVLLALLVLVVASSASASGGGHWSSWARRPWILQDVPSTALWVRADRGITLGGTLKAAGTTPPAVTISGTLTQALGVYIEITTGGSRGTALFKWSLDNGSTFQQTGQTTAATFDLGTTGITANFPAATYTNDNIYRATVAQWNDSSANARHLTQATAGKQPLYIVNSVNGRPILRFDGVDDFMGVAYTRTQPITVFFAYKGTAGGAGTHDIVLNGGTLFQLDWAVDTFGGGRYYLFSGSTGTIQSATVATTFSYLTFKFNGAPSNIRINGASASTGDVGANNGTGFYVGCVSDGTQCSVFDAGDISDVVGASAANDVTVAESHLKQDYGL